MSEEKTNVLLLGSGGREHALLLQLLKSSQLGEMWVAPGNGGMNQIAQHVDLSVEDTQEILAFAQSHNINLVVIGPEAPLVAGVADVLRAAGIQVFGPNKEAAHMEGSKAFAKEIMVEAGVKTAQYKTFTDEQAALDYIDHNNGPCVVKADGLAAGKGVFVCKTVDEAKKGVKECFDGAFGESGYEVVIEEMLEGPECSLLVLTDGKEVVPMAVCQDHKRALDGDLGPNTGGMGVYSPVPFVTEVEYDFMLSEIKKVVETLHKRGIVYSGCLYGGFMLTSDGPYVLEFNARFGDPETQVIMPRMQADLVEVMKACDAGTLTNDMVAWKKNWAFSVVLTSKGYPASYKKGFVITGIDEANKLENVHVVHAGTALNDAGEVITAGGRVLNVVAEADTFEEARKLCYKACELIDFEGKTYRSDIGYRALQPRS